MTGESVEMRELVRQNLDLPQIIADLLENASSSQIRIPKMFIRNYVWVANNMSKIKLLTEIEVKNICYIFITQIGQFLQKNEKDENSLIDVIGGLAHISSQGNEQFIKYATGFGIFPQGNEILEHMIELLGSKHEQIYYLSLKYVGSVMGSDNKEITDKI